MARHAFFCWSRTVRIGARHSRKSERGLGRFGLVPCDFVAAARNDDAVTRYCRDTNIRDNSADNGKTANHGAIRALSIGGGGSIEGTGALSVANCSDAAHIFR